MGSDAIKIDRSYRTKHRVEKESKTDSAMRWTLLSVSLFLAIGTLYFLLMQNSAVREREREFKLCGLCSWYDV